MEKGEEEVKAKQKDRLMSTPSFKHSRKNKIISHWKKVSLDVVISDDALQRSLEMRKNFIASELNGGIRRR